ncbi:lytic transglycosylase domain-containing protein [Streptomyces sp. NPDC002952]|uniref:lytic transglycosylase domain-containing protein n=1 Tax=Streptomyces sp. NPDC002952 TaxID=3364673 RepID=UPI0036A30E95
MLTRGRQLRRGLTASAVVAVTVAALAASQAPQPVGNNRNQPINAAGLPPASSSSRAGASGNSPYYTDLPPLDSPEPGPTPSPVIGTPVSRGEAEAGIPATVLDAYRRAAAELRGSKPGCNLPWELLAAIGKVESGQARGGRVDADGTTLGRILGPQLDGNGFALIKDTDNGRYDGNSSYDQAVGPLQFIPSTWAWAGHDGNGDGVKDPNNVYDAALAAGHYLCRNGWDLSTQGGLRSAILSYNNSQDYLNLVLNWLEYYRKGSHSVPDGTGGMPTHRSDEHTGRLTGTPSPTDPPQTKPHHEPHHPPGKPPQPGTSGSGDESHDPAPPKQPVPPKPPTPSGTVDHLADAGTGELTARAGDDFARRISTRAETKAGTAVGKVRIRFIITGYTDTTFADGGRAATVATDAKGVAVAPALKAGNKTGGFTVTTAVIGHRAKGIDYTATVTPRTADTLTLTSDTPLTCASGGEFADPVQAQATYKGAVADKVAATATLIKSAYDLTENDKGPSFKDADGKPVRTLTGLETDDKGLLTLPELYADDTTGTFLLRIVTTGGATLIVELRVVAAGTPS